MECAKKIREEFDTYLANISSRTIEIQEIQAYLNVLTLHNEEVIKDLFEESFAIEHFESLVFWHASYFKICPLDEKSKLSIG